MTDLHHHGRDAISRNDIFGRLLKGNVWRNAGRSDRDVPGGATVSRAARDEQQR